MALNLKIRPEPSRPVSPCEDGGSLPCPEPGSTLTLVERLAERSRSSTAWRHDHHAVGKCVQQIGLGYRVMHRILRAHEPSNLYTPSFTEPSPSREVENEAVERNTRLKTSRRTARAQGTTIAVLSDPVCVESTPTIHGNRAAPRPETASM